MNLSTGNIIRASETSAESGKSHSAGAVIRVSDATVDVTAGKTLIKPEHFARQEIYLIKDGQFVTPYTSSQWIKTNGGYTKPDQATLEGFSKIRSSYTQMGDFGHDSSKQSMWFRMQGGGSNNVKYIGGYRTALNELDINKIKTINIVCSSPNVSAITEQEIKISIFKPLVNFWGESDCYDITFWDDKEIFNYPVDNAWLYINNNTYNSFYNQTEIPCSTNINLTGTDYYLIIAAGGFGDDWDLYIKNLWLEFK